MERNDIHLAMQPDECHLLESFLRCTSNYLEFGAGGSTVLASTMVRKSVVSVDSSQDWLEFVRLKCAMTPLQPTLIYADIGEIVEWGYPANDASKEKWPSYFSEVWDQVDAAAIDFCLIDGRFRVASMLSALLNCGPRTNFGIHDYLSREKYHIIARYADEIARASDLSVFTRKRTVSDHEIKLQLSAWMHVPD